MAAARGGAGGATLVANVSFLLALILLYGLTTLEYTEDIARRSVVLLASFPASFVFMAPYSESLFLLSSLAAFWWARRGGGEGRRSSGRGHDGDPGGRARPDPRVADRGGEQKADPPKQGSGG